jgi:sugar/nucleoside kinase (ribokinase family)
MKNQCVVFCIGNAVADILARPVDHLAPPGESQRLEDVVIAPGGNCINTGIALARQGVAVDISTVIGGDRLGQFVRERVRAEGIDDSGLTVLPGAKTSISLVLVQANGERRFLHMRGASANFSEQNLDWTKMAGARIVHYASAFALPAFDGAPLERTLRRAREMGCLTSMNICWDVQARWLSLLRAALAHTDFIFPNQKEGQQLTGESDPFAIARGLRRLGVKTAIIKLGAAGCFVDGPEGDFISPGFAVDPVDTTGAGDCFAAAFLAAICRGLGHAEAATYANAAGALSTLGMGGADSAPTSAEIEEFRRRYVPQ